MWSDDFLEDDKWMKIRNHIPEPILNNWKELSESIKRKFVKKVAQQLMEEESKSSRVIDPLLREITTEEAFEPPMLIEDIGRLIPKPIPLAEGLVPIEKADPSIPGEIVVSETGKLLKRYLKYTNFTLFLKESYDQWLINELVPLIENQKIILKEGQIFFRDVSLLLPTTSGGKKPLYPRMARERGITYDLAIHATIVVEQNFEDGEVREIFVSDKRLIGKIPLMLGSKHDQYLYNLSPTELRAIGEDPSDPFGYFVVSGAEKVVLLHEKLRLNRIFVNSKKRGKEIYPEASITVETKGGSARVNLIFEKYEKINFQTRFKADIRPPSKSKSEKMDPARRKKLIEESKRRQSIASKKDGNYRYIGVEKLFYILQLLEMEGPEGDFENILVNTDYWPEIMSDRIVKFTKEEWRSKVSLKSSMLKFLYPQDAPKLVFQDIANTKGGADFSDFGSVKDVVLELVDREIFPQLNNLKKFNINNIYSMKSDMLAMMVARLIEVNIGLTTYDDRDSWSNKRLETASRAMNQLFNSIWRKYISSIKKNVANKNIKTVSTSIMQEKSYITEIFESSFKGDNWGVQGSMRSNMTQKVNRDSVISLYSHMHRVEVATNRNDKQPSIRMIHGTQFGYICVTGDTQVNINKFETKPIKEIHDGDTVLTVSKDDLSESPSRIKNSFSLIPSSLLEITTITGRQIKCTPDHPFLVTRKDKSINEYQDWVKAGEIKVGERVIVKVDEKEEYQIYKNRKGKVSEYNAFIEKYKIINGKLSLPIESIKEIPVEKVYDFETLHNNHSFIANGFVTHNCPVESPEGQHCLKIGSLVETPSGHVKIELLKNGDQVICVDPVSHEREITEIHSHFIKPAQVFELEIVNGKSIITTSDHPFLVQENKWKMLKDLKIGECVYVQYQNTSENDLELLNKYYDGKGFFLPITSIVPKGKERVCDFTTVSDHHSFISNGFVTHNCGIVKNLAVTAQVTYGKPDHNAILEVLNSSDEDGNNLFSPSYTRECNSPVLVNGKFLGWCDGSRLRRHMILCRRNGTLPEDMGITLNYRNNLLIHTDTSRLVRPLLVVEPVTKPDGEIVYEPLIKTKGLMGASTDTLFREGVIEYVDSFEVESVDTFVAETFENVENRRKSIADLVVWSRELVEQLGEIEERLERDPDNKELKEKRDILDENLRKNGESIAKLRDRRRFSHVEMDPTSIMGISANIIPYPNHNQGPRNTYQCLKDDTLVWMANGKYKMIRDVKVGDKVWSFNSKSMNYETTEVINQFVKQTTKKIYEIEIFSGRKITATYDHKFWTSNGWVSVEEFDSNTRLAMSKANLVLEEIINYCNSSTDTENKTLFVPIKSVTEVKNCLIADITTKSDNHSFVANGFCVHNSSMAKQALGIMRAHHMACFDGKHKVLAYPTRPLFEPQLNQLLNLNAYPQGEMVWVAFNTFTGDNQEDAVIWNRASIELGKFRFYKFNNIRVTFKSTSAGRVEKLQLPEGLTAEQIETTYKHINANGLPDIGVHIEQRQVVIGKVVIEGKKQVADESVKLGYGEEGIVDRIIVTKNGAETIATVRLRLLRIPVEGDKFAPRNAQKGTIGRIVDPEDLPYTEDGIIPDIIVNPHAMPSRMTMTYVMEMIASKAGAIRGERQNATAFGKWDEEKFRSVLRDYGYMDNGYHVMYSGKTGKKLPSLIYSGPVYFQALKHHVKDKIQARREGPINAASRQPVKGRAKMGGLRFGEMERNAVIAHGAAYITQERLCVVSDCVKAVYCKCGLAAESKQGGGYVCRRCGDDKAVFGYVKTTAALNLLNMFLSTFGFSQTLGFKVTNPYNRTPGDEYMGSSEKIPEFPSFDDYEGNYDGDYEEDYGYYEY